MIKWYANTLQGMLKVPYQWVLDNIPRFKNGHYVAYTVLPTRYDKKLGYQLVMAVWSEAGYYPMQVWVNVGDDFAEAEDQVEKLNGDIGLKHSEVIRIILQSMRKHNEQ